MSHDAVKDPKVRVRVRRQALLAITGMLLALLVPAAGATGTSPQKSSVRLTVSVASSKIKPNARTKVTVKLTSGKKAVKNAKVTVQQRVQGTKKWKTLGTVKTDRRGKASIKTKKQTKNVQYRATYSGKKKKATSSAKLVRVKQSVTLTRVLATTVTVGDAITFVGKTSPALAGGTAELQAKIDGNWFAIGSARIAGNRTFSVSGKATVGGQVAYRVQVKAGRAVDSANSVSRLLNVYAWYYLHDYRAVTWSNFYFRDTVTMAGRDYIKTLGSGRSGVHSSAEYNLSYRCTKFASTVGVPDSSGRLAEARFFVSVDDLSLLDTSAGLAAPKDIEVDVSGGFRLYMRTERKTGSPSSDYESFAAWGSARVLCLGAP